jgi:hypothetical protein
MLRDGEISLLVDDGGLEAVNAVAHALDLATVSLVRAEEGDEKQERTVMTHAGSLPLIWVAPAFGEAARTWARDRGPMTLLVATGGSVSDDERHRIERFVALLGRQAE